MEFITHSAAETEEAGRSVGQKLLGRRFFLALYGDLGAGKTVFVRGIASVLSPGSRVKSPTYTIVNEYRRGPVPLYHFDLYRITTPDELYGFGFDEYVENGACIAEWSEHLGQLLPPGSIRVTIEKCGENDRKIIIEEAAL